MQWIFQSVEAIMVVTFYRNAVIKYLVISFFMFRDSEHIE